MNIEPIPVTIQELIDGYEEKGPDGIEGAVAYGGRLDVRPAYQREYIDPDKDRKKRYPIKKDICTSSPTRRNILVCRPLLRRRSGWLMSAKAGSVPIVRQRAEPKSITSSAR